MNLNGNTQALPGSAPLKVAHPEVGVVPGDARLVVGGGEIVVPGGFLGHSVVPVVVLTQPMTSRRIRFC